MKKVFAIRGATRAQNTAESIQKETCALCSALFSKNQLAEQDVVCVQFSLTSDLDAMNPATALRKGRTEFDASTIPLFCTQEAKIKGGLDHVIRVMIFAYMVEGANIYPVYQNGAECLRPDIASTATDNNGDAGKAS